MCLCQRQTRIAQAWLEVNCQNSSETISCLQISGRIMVGPGGGGLAHLKDLAAPQNICFERVQGGL